MLRKAGVAVLLHQRRHASKPGSHAPRCAQSGGSTIATTLTFLTMTLARGDSWDARTATTFANFDHRPPSCRSAARCWGRHLSVRLRLRRGEHRDQRHRRARRVHSASVLGIPFAAPLAVLLGVFDLLPLVGATIAAVIRGDRDPLLQLPNRHDHLGHRRGGLPAGREPDPHPGRVPAHRPGLGNAC